MAETTGIEWTDATWNPWVGCIKISEGCKNCYMYRDQARYGNDPRAIRRTSPATFRAPLRWDTGQRVFTCSWSDFFIEEADGWRGDAWDVIRARPDLAFQVLTKRPQNVADRLPADWGNGWPNVWLGVSAENQARWDERVPVLLDTTAAVRFVSAEPLIGPIVPHGLDRLDWLIVGGESGPDARAIAREHFISLMHAADAAGVPFFFKQWGGARRIGGVWGGNVIEGVTRQEFPATRPAQPRLF